MREKSSECHTHSSHVRAMTDMCSRDPPAALHPSLSKANGKNPSPQPSQRINNDHRLTSNIEDDGSPTAGGRLKFFKDGKFILELSHRRDGDRTTWFPVPKKTFWPPASVVTSRQESSASLSVSDDNSSIQSSPWQRDHCWKQTHPRRNISSEFNFFYYRNKKTKLNFHPTLIARKRRQPLDCSSLFSPTCETFSNQRSRKTNGGTTNTNKSLNIIIDKLARLLDPNVVSPRKRILRELGKANIEDQVSKRRATPQPTNSTLAPSNTPSPSPKHLSSYSITSILGEDKTNSESEPVISGNLSKSHEREINYKYPPTAQSYSPRVDSNAATNSPTSFVNSISSSSIHQPFYSLPYSVPPTYRGPPFCWMPYTSPMHYPPPLSVYSAPQHLNRPSTTSPPAHRYREYREQSLTPPSGTLMPIRRSSNHRSSPVHSNHRNTRHSQPSPHDLYDELRDSLRVSDMPLNLSKHAG